MSRTSPGIILQPLVGAEEPATGLLHATERPRVVPDVDAHLGALVQQVDGALDVAAVQLLEEVFHRVDSTHTPSI